MADQYYGLDTFFREEFPKGFDAFDYTDNDYVYDNATAQQLAAASKEAQQMGITIKGLLQDLEHEARARGMSLVIRPTGRGEKEFEVYYKPNVKGIDTSLEKLPYFVFSGVDDKGLISRYGQKALNQGRLDLNAATEQLAMYHIVEEQLRDQIRQFQKGQPGSNRLTRNLAILNSTSEKITQADRERALRQIRSAVSYRGRQSLSGVTTTTSYQKALEAEMEQAMQGTGSARSQAIRAGYMSLRPLIDSILDETRDAAKAAFKQSKHGRNYTASERDEQMAHDMMSLFALYAQDLDLKNIESSIAAMAKQKTGPAYLWNSKDIQKYIREVGRKINALRPDFGPSQEGSLNNFLISLVGNKDLSVFASLGDAGNRKHLQTAGGLARSENGKKALQELQAKGRMLQKKVYTQWEVNRQLDQDLASTAQYMLLQVTDDDLAKAQEKLYKKYLRRTNPQTGKNYTESEARQLSGLEFGAHAGGVLISNKYAPSLNAVMERSLTVDEKLFQQQVQYYKDKLAGAKGKDFYANTLKGSIRENLQERVAQLWGSDAGFNIDAIQDTEIRDAFQAAIEEAAAWKLVMQKEHPGKDAIGKPDTKFKHQVFGLDGAQRRTIFYQTYKDAKAGSKVLGQEFFDVKGRQAVVAHELINQVIDDMPLPQAAKNALKKKTSGLITAEGLSVRNFDTKLEGFFQALMGTLKPAQAEYLLGKPGLSDWLKRDKHGRWVAQKDRFKADTDVEARQNLISFIDALNQGVDELVAGGIVGSNGKIINADPRLAAFQNGFTIKNGEITMNASAPVATAMSLAMEYDYGAPGGRQMPVDYRFRGAIDRLMVGAGLQNGMSMKELSDYLLGTHQRRVTGTGRTTWDPILTAEGALAQGGVYSGHADQQKAYQRWQQGAKAVEEALELTQKSGTDWSVDQLLNNNDVVLGWGSKEDFLAAYGVDPDDPRYNALRRALMGRYLDMSESGDPSQWLWQPEYLEGHLTQESWDKSFGKIEKLQAANQGGKTWLALPTGGASNPEEGLLAAQAIALPEIAKLLEGKDPITSTLLSDRKDAQGNRLPYTLHDIPEAYRGLTQLLTAMWNYSTTTGRLGEAIGIDEERVVRERQALMEAVPEFLKTMQQEYTSKEGSAWQDAHKVDVGHSMWAKALAVPGKQRQGEDWARLYEVATRVSTEDADALLKPQNEDTPAEYLAALKVNYHYMMDELKDYDKVEADLEKLLKDAVDDDAKIQKLVDELKEQATVGSEKFKARWEEAKSRGVAFRGLASSFVRFPLSNGLDVQHADLLFDEALAKGTVLGGVGSAAGVNTDFDGDTVAAMLYLTRGDLLSALNPDQLRNIIKQAQATGNFSRAVNAAEAAAYRNIALFDKAGESKLLGKGSVNIEKLITRDANQRAALLSRLNKNYTGRLSNNYQAITETLAALGLHANEVSPENATGDRDLFMRDMIVRGVFEGMTQDAISAKKTRERLTKRYGKGWDSDTRFLSEIDDLMGLFKNSQTYESNEGIKAALQKGVQMGIFGDEGNIFDSRITARIFAVAQQLYKGREDEEVKFWETLGIDPKQAKNLKFEYDTQGQVVGFAGTKFGAGKNNQAIAQAMALDINTVTKALSMANAQLKHEGLGGLSSVQWNKGALLPGGVKSGPLFQLGDELLSAEQYEKLKELNPALASLADEYGALSKSAEVAAKSLGVEADAERTKIGIAQEEAKAINAGTTAYQKRQEALDALTKTMDRSSIYDKSVSNLLNDVYGTGGFMPDDQLKSILEQARAIYNKNKQSFVTKGLEGLEGIDDEQFRTARIQYLSSWRGKVADAVEQLLTYANQELQSSKEDQKLLGKTQFTSVKEIEDFISQPENSSKLAIALRAKMSNDQRGEEGLWTILSEGEKYLRPLLGWNRARLARESWINAGESLWAQLLAEAGGDVSQLGARELKLTGAATDASSIFHGRADIVRSRNEKYTDEDGIERTRKILEIIDKKTVDDIASLDKKGVKGRYIGQEMLYGLAMHQLRNILLSRGYTSDNYDAFWGSSEGKLWKARAGYKDGEEFDRDTWNALVDPSTKLSYLLHYTDEKGSQRTYTLNDRFWGDGSLFDRLQELLSTGMGEEFWGSIRDAVEKMASLTSSFDAGQTGNSTYANAIKAETELADLLKGRREIQEQLLALQKERDKSTTTPSGIHQTALDKKILELQGKLSQGGEYSEAEIAQHMEALGIERDKDGKITTSNTSIAGEDIVNKVQDYYKDLDTDGNLKADPVTIAAIQEKVIKAAESTLETVQKLYNAVVQTALKEGWDSQKLEQELQTLIANASPELVGRLEQAQELGRLGNLDAKNTEDLEKKFITTTDRTGQDTKLINTEGWYAAAKAKAEGKSGRGSSGGGGKKPDQMVGLGPAMQSTFQQFVSRFFGGMGLYRIFGKVRQGIAKAIQNAVALDQTLTNLQITTGATREDTRTLISTYSQLGRQLGATTQEVAASALEWQRQGYEAAEVADLVTSSLYLSKLGMIDASTATQNLTSALKGFKIAASQSMDVVDKLTAIDLKAATSAGEIANGLAQFANIGSLSGVNIDEAAAYVATIADVTQMSGSSAGQALKTIISRYGNVKAGAFNKMTLDADTGDGTSLNDVERVLSKLGISIRDSNLSFKDFSTVLEEIADKWQTLDNVSQRAISNAFAGVRQQEAFTTLLQNWDKYQELLKTSQQSKGTAETKYAAYQQSLQAAQNARKTTWEQLINNAEISDLLVNFNRLLEQLGKVLPTLLKWLPQAMIWLNQLGDVMGRGLFSNIFKMLQDRQIMDERGMLHLRINQAQMTADSDRQRVNEQAKTNETREQLQNEQAETAASQGGTSTSGKKGGVLARGAARGIAAGLSYGLGQLASGFTAYETMGATHKYVNSKGEETVVNSSNRARTAARGYAAALSAAFPIVGTIAGNILADRLTKEIDRARDKADEATRVAQERLQVLNATDANLATMVRLRNASTLAEEIERDQATAEYIAELYKSDNAELRGALEKYLKNIYGETVSIREVTEKIHTGSEKERAQAAHALKLAQAQASHAEMVKSRAADDYAARETLREAQLRYNSVQPGYTSNGITEEERRKNRWAAGGIGAGTGVSVAAGTLGMTAAAAGTIPVAGWIVAGVLGTAAAALAIWKAYESLSTQSELEAQEDWALRDDFESLGIDDKITALRESEDNLKVAVEENTEGAADQLAATRELRKAFEDYRERLRAQQDEDNKAKMDQALIYAGWQYGGGHITDKTQLDSAKYFLSDLNLTQAKHYGQKELYDTLAAALGDNTLTGRNIKTASGEYSEYFVKYARRIMSENDAVGSVLSGEVYTLNEALKEIGWRTDQFSRETMSNFATAMRVALKDLGDYSDLLGELTLAELYMTTTELEEEFDNLSGLLGKVADGSQSVTKWMSEIVTKYPELINYMSNTPALITAIVNKLMDLNNQTMREQFEEYADSDSFWKKTVKPQSEAWLKEQLALNKITQREYAATLELIRDKDIDTLKKAVDKLNIVPSLDENSELRRLYELMEEAVEAGTAGVTLRSDIWTEQTQKLTAFVAEQLQTQISALEAQKEALQDVNKQRQFEVDLLNARNKLSDALNEKQRIYRTGVGFVYEPDQGAIKKAKEELQEVQLQKDVSKITKQIDILQLEAKYWETYWSNRTAQLQEAVITEIWGKKNVQDFQGALFSENSTLLKASNDGLKVDEGSLQTQLGKIFGVNAKGDGTNFVTSLNTAIWGFTNNSPGTWWQHTFSSSLAPLEAYLSQIVENQQAESDRYTEPVESAYNELKKLAVERAEGGSVTPEQWNTALETFTTAYNRALDAGYINDDWVLNQSYAKMDTTGGKWQYLASPATMAKHSDSYWWTPEETAAGAGAAFLGKTTKAAKVDAEGSAYAWGASATDTKTAAPDDRIDNFTPIANTSDFSTGLENVQYELEHASGASGRQRAWYWTANTIGLSGQEFSSSSDQALQDAFTKAGNWRDVAKNLAQEEYGEMLVWTGAGGYVLLSNGQAYKVTTTHGTSISDHDETLAVFQPAGILDGKTDAQQMVEDISVLSQYAKEQREAKEQEQAQLALWASRIQAQKVDQNGITPYSGSRFWTEDSTSLADLEYISSHLSEISKLLKSTYKWSKLDINTLENKLQQEIALRHKLNNYATGTIGSTAMGWGLINESGTEAIITPAGTITALPAHTGIVPADITRNLWQLGEVAPSILRVVETIAPNNSVGAKSSASITDQSFNISTLSMNVNADDSFDVDAFIEAIKSRVALTHHAHK